MKAQPSDLDATTAPFTVHLAELRKRLIIALGFILVGCAIGWALHEQTFDWLMQPYTKSMMDLRPDDASYMNYRSLIEPVVVYLKTTLLFAVIVSAPFVLHQLWMFIGPGLYKSERQLAIPFILSTLFFFTGGVAFCRYVVLAPSAHVLLQFAEASATPVIMMEEYFAFTSRMLLVFGALFELPVVITFLTLINAVEYKWLIKQWRYVIVLAFLVGAMMTPPDPLTQVALAVPLVILYALSVVVSYLIYRVRLKKGDKTNDEANDTELDDDPQLDDEHHRSFHAQPGDHPLDNEHPLDDEHPLDNDHPPTDPI